MPGWEPKSGQAWKPSTRQERFLELPNEIFEALYGGAAGGGKSENLIMLPIAKGFTQYPSYHGITFRRTFPQLEESIIPRARPIYEAIGANYNATKHAFTFPSGARIQLSYMEKDEHARDHDTAEYNTVCFDELTHFSEFQYLYLTSRCRTTSNLPAIVRSATNPGNIGHIWVKNRFVSPWKAGGRLIKDKLSGAYRIFIPAKLQDNPYLTKADPEYANRLAILPEAERRAKLDGDWDIFTGQVFSEFRSLHLPSEPENALHVIDPFVIPFYWPRILAVDWGHRAQTYALWLALAPDGRIYIYREYSRKKASVAEWASDIVKLSQGENIVVCEIDPSSKQNRGSETIFDQFVRHVAGAFPIHPADNDRIGGKGLVHETLRYIPRPKRYLDPLGYSQEQADGILRMYGLDAYKDYLHSFEPDKPELNIPRLQIFKTVRQLIELIPSLVYHETRVEDVQDFDGDDPYDTLRYGLKAIDRWLETSKDEHEKFSSLDKIYEGLKSTGDHNAFVRQMREYEARQGNDGPVFH